MLRLRGAASPSLVARADRARDAGQWEIAAQYYGKFLDRDPCNSAIRVQYGHALKESGHLAEAEAAYRRALGEQPEVADSHLQLGHVLKLQGKTEEAKTAYLRALLMFERLPSEPRRELAALGWSESGAFARQGKSPVIEPTAIVDGDPWDVLKRKDVIMREVFNGIVKATHPDVICDIGSFGGEESARLRRIAPDSRLFAFEANNDNITRFIEPRRDLERVTIENIAVCDVDGEMTFHTLGSESGPEEFWWRAAGSLNVRVDDIPCIPVTVPSVRLDTYFKDELKAKSTFVLWIDVEGALDRVFAGAEEVLSQTILFRAEVERREFWAGQKMAEEVIAVAERAGFVLLGDTWTPEATEQSDVLMINARWPSLAANSANNAKRALDWPEI
jgi:FkbM family methyltransferase